jgi:hypothetical protein
MQQQSGWQAWFTRGKLEDGGNGGAELAKAEGERERPSLPLGSLLGDGLDDAFRHRDCPILANM